MILRFIFWFLRKFSPFTAAEDLCAGDPVYLVGALLLGRCMANTAAKVNVLGVSYSACKKGEHVLVRQHGLVPGVLMAAQQAEPCYLQASGGIAFNRPGPGMCLVRIGYAVNATDLFVHVQEYRFLGGFRGQVP